MMRYSSKVFFLIGVGFTIYAILNISLTVIEYLKVLSNELNEDAYKDQRLRPINIILSPTADYCNNVKFLITIHTRVNDSVGRDVIRMSYGTPSLARKFKYKLLFALGVHNKSDQSLMDRVALEHHWNGDILQSDFIDSYKNITLKQLSQLRFFNSHCSDSTVLVKLDDDVAWNVKRVADYISKLDNKTSIDCLKWSGMEVVREKHDKWYVPPETYAPSTYPDYCSGMAYIARAQAVKKMVKYIKETTFFWIDDVFITGMLALAANVTLNDITEKYMLWPKPYDLNNGTAYFAVLQEKASALEWFYKVNNETLQKTIT